MIFLTMKVNNKFLKGKYMDLSMRTTYNVTEMIFKVPQPERFYPFAFFYTFKIKFGVARPLYGYYMRSHVCVFNLVIQ